MSGGADESIPVRIESAGAASAALDPMTRFVLDQVDGRATPSAIADATMLEPAQIETILRTLASKGLVRYGAPVAATPAASPPAATTSADESPESRVEKVHAALASATHYEILGVEPAADKAYFKRAYFVLSKEFHPDSSPHRKVPGVRPKLEAIFRKLTDAHDVISRPKRRDAYDAELAKSRTTPFTVRLHPPIELPKPEASAEPAPQAASANPPSPAPTPPTASDAAAAAPKPAPNASPSTPMPAPRPGGLPSTLRTPVSTARPATVPQGASSSARPPLAGSASQSSIRMPTSSPGSPRPVQVSPSIRTAAADAATPQSRERAPTPPSTTTGPSNIGRTPDAVPTAATPASAADRQRSLLRALHGASQITGPIDKTAQYERQATEADAAGDLKAAVSFLRVAAQIAPDREDLRHKLTAADRKLAKSELPVQRERAQSEERANRFDTAAIAWNRVCLGAPEDAEAHSAAARCLLAAKLDLRQARDLAQRAIDLAPNRVEFRIVLVRVFQEAGMRLNARREAEAAAKLDPSNQLVKNLQRELE